MLPVAGLLWNVISGLVVDKATDLAKEHVDKMIDDVLPDSAKKELDKIIKADPTHTFDNAKEDLEREFNYQELKQEVFNEKKMKENLET